MTSTTNTKLCGIAWATASIVCNLPRGHEPGNHAYSTARERAERRTSESVREEVETLIEAEIARAQAFGPVAASVLAFGITSNLIAAGLLDGA